MLTRLWDCVAQTFSAAKEEVSGLFHWQETWSITEDTGKTVFYTPAGIDNKGWQEMIKAKIGGETDWPWDIQNMHIACSMAVKMLEGRGVKPEDMLPILTKMDINPKRLLPAFVLGPEKPVAFETDKLPSSQLQSLLEMKPPEI